MFLSFDMVIPTIILLSSSITTHQIQTNSEPTFIKVSSMMNSLIFFLIDAIF